MRGACPVLWECRGSTRRRGGRNGPGDRPRRRDRLPGAYLPCQYKGERGAASGRPPPGRAGDGETAPHYIALTDAQLLSRDADYRMNPPLRSEQDVAAVLQGLKDGTLTVIATDHAPHAPEEKADFVKAPNGAVGLETSLAVCYTKLVVPGLLTLSELVTLMAWNPARLLRVPGGTRKRAHLPT